MSKDLLKIENMMFELFTKLNTRFFTTVSIPTQRVKIEIKFAKEHLFYEAKIKLENAYAGKFFGQLSDIESACDLCDNINIPVELYREIYSYSKHTNRLLKKKYDIIWEERMQKGLYKISKFSANFPKSTNIGE